MPEKADNSEITLGVLNAVEKNSRITQRDVAQNIGIALGLTNTYLKRCIKKGLIKVQQVPANRYAYYLTPRGFAEKSRLTGEYLSQGFQFFRVARNQLIEIFKICQQRKFKRIVLHGLTDIAEIAILSSSHSDVQIVGIIDSSSSHTEYAGIPVVRDLNELEAFDAIIISDWGDSQTTLRSLSKILSFDRLFTPQILTNYYINQFEDQES